jgi:hypothetical protein
MKRVTAVFIFTLTVASLSPVQAQVGYSPQFQTPLDYRFSVQPRSHVFSYNRQHRHRHWRHANRTHFYPALRGPAVIFQNGEIGIPPEPEYTATVPAVPTVATPVVYRLGETSACDVQRVHVPGSRGRTAVNIWRC